MGALAHVHQPVSSNAPWVIAVQGLYAAALYTHASCTCACMTGQFNSGTFSHTHRYIRFTTDANTLHLPYVNTLPNPNGPNVNATACKALWHMPQVRMHIYHGCFAVHGSNSSSHCLSMSRCLRICMHIHLHMIKSMERSYTVAVWSMLPGPVRLR